MSEYQLAFVSLCAYARKFFQRMSVKQTQHLAEGVLHAYDYRDFTRCLSKWREQVMHSFSLNSMLPVIDYIVTIPPSSLLEGNLVSGRVIGCLFEKQSVSRLRACLSFILRLIFQVYL